MLTLNESIRRDTAACLNGNALAALPAEFPGITLANKRFGYERGEWRALKRNGGTLRGLAHLGKLTILATDGLQAWFAKPEETFDLFGDLDPATLCVQAKRRERAVFLGHVANFDGKVEPLYSSKQHTTTSKPKAATKRAPSARQQLLNSL